MGSHKTRQLDFVMAFTQADVERDLYTELPKNFSVPGTKVTYEDKDKYVLKLVKNLYSQNVKLKSHIQCQNNSLH